MPCCSKLYMPPTKSFWGLSSFASETLMNMPAIRSWLGPRKACYRHQSMRYPVALAAGICKQYVGSHTCRKIAFTCMCPKIHMPAMVLHATSPKAFLCTSIVLSSLRLHNQSSIGCVKTYVLC